MAAVAAAFRTRVASKSLTGSITPLYRGSGWHGSEGFKKLPLLPVTSRCHLCRRLLTVSSSSTKERFMETRVALITGSTSGIGLGMARNLASRGCSVILNGFGDDELIQSLKDEFKSKYNSKVDYVYADLSKVAEIEQMYETVKGIYPSGVDVIVNNAGFQFVSPIEDFPVDKWDTMIALMLSAPFHIIRKFLPDMRKKGWGRIINISSAHGIVASPNKAPYVTVKHGIIGLTKVVALETAGSGVTCNAICPGYVDTPILKMQVNALADKEGISYDEAEVKFLSSFHASKRAVGVDHVAEMAAFLCSEAGNQVTGSSMVMDGGWTAQ